MHDDQKVIIFEGLNSAFEKLASKCAEYEYAPRFELDTELAFDKTRQREVITKYADPYIIDFLKQTGTSATFNNKFCTYWVTEKINDKLSEGFPHTEYSKLTKFIEDIDGEYSKLGTTIVYCNHESKSVIEQEIHQKYLDFLNISLCKSIAIDVSLINEEENFNRITSFLETHKRFRNYRDSFYKKFIDYGNIVGNKILFIIDGDYEHLTKNDLRTRINAKSGSEFEFLCNTQFKSSNTFKVIDEILNRTSINKFETSYTPLKKINYKEVTKEDLDFMRLELNLLRPKTIVTFSDKLAKAIRRLDEARFSKVESFNMSLAYSNEMFDKISEKISA